MSTGNQLFCHKCSILLLFCMSVCRCVGFFSTHSISLASKRPKFHVLYLTKRKRSYRGLVPIRKRYFKKRYDGYWSRVGREDNCIIPSDRIVSTFVPRTSFVAKSVLPMLCFIEKSSAPPIVNDTFGAMYIPPTRQNMFQFLVDVSYIFNVMDAVVDSCEDLRMFGATGPMDRTFRFKKDIDYLSKNLLKSPPPTVSNEAQQYAVNLEAIAENSRPGFIAHYFNFYQEWSMASKQLLKSLTSMLDIPKRFNVGFYDGDTKALQVVLDSLADKWSPSEQNDFLKELRNANSMAMCLSVNLCGKSIPTVDS